MPAHWKKWLVIAVALVVVLKFREQIVNAISGLPVVGPFVK